MQRLVPEKRISFMFQTSNLALVSTGPQLSCRRSASTGNSVRSVSTRGMLAVGVKIKHDKEKNQLILEHYDSAPISLKSVRMLK